MSGDIAWGVRRIRFIDALRTLSLVWIAIFHVIFYAPFFVSKAEAARLFDSFGARCVLRGHFALDLLFVITGFLIGDSLLADADRGKLSYRTFLVRRAARLVPAYLVALLIYHFTLNFNFETVWANVLYINNYIPLAKQTMSWSWSLPVDVHFYLLFPLLLLVVPQRGRHLLWALGITFVLLVGVRAWVDLANSLSLPLEINPNGNVAAFERYFNVMYDKTHTRIGAIVCGLMVATLVRYHGAERLLAARPKLALWLGAAAAAVLAVDLGWPMFPGEAGSYDPILSALYLVWYNYAFALAASYLMLLLLSDLEAVRPVVRWLSWPGWFVSSELCYGVFLLNPMVTLGLYAFVWKPTNLNGYLMIEYAFVSLVTVFALAGIMYLTVERPCRRWGRRLAQRFES
ncbi:MAG: acyltransferase [Candidatus Baltobacteraceae bacterium]